MTPLELHPLLCNLVPTSTYTSHDILHPSHDPTSACTIPSFYQSVRVRVAVIFVNIDMLKIFRRRTFTVPCRTTFGRKSTHVYEMLIIVKILDANAITWYLSCDCLPICNGYKYLRASFWYGIFQFLISWCNSYREGQVKRHDGFKG